MSRLFFCPCLALLLICGAAFAETNENESEVKSASGLPLPRFASLRSNEVNLRTGPGTRYPIEWVFLKEGLPVEITAEFDVWRRVRDSEGSVGWVHKSNLSGKRSLITTGQAAALRKQPAESAAIKAHVRPGAIGWIASCREAWCEVSFGALEGYMKKEDFWGAYEHETFR